MIILGIVLALLGYLLGIPIIGPVGVILIAGGVILWVLGATGHTVGGRRNWY